MIAANYRKFPEALALQMPLKFGRVLVWATSRPTTRVLRAIRAARGAAFKAAGRIAYPVARTVPSWVKAKARRSRELGKAVKKACMSLGLVFTSHKDGLNPFARRLHDMTMQRWSSM